MSQWNRRMNDDVEGDILNPDERGHHFEGLSPPLPGNEPL